MKTKALNSQFFFNPVETLDFKTFCEGGSPEYVTAKQKLKELYQKHQEGVGCCAVSSQLKVEPSGFHRFVESRRQKHKSSNVANFGEISLLNVKEPTKRPSFPVFSLYINPLALFDIHFLLAAGCVVLVAILEKKLADNGIIAPAAILNGILKVGFPLVAFGSILVLISKLGVFL
jgi:hypothetical protein